MKKIYLDNNATTCVDEKVLEIHIELIEMMKDKQHIQEWICIVYRNEKYVKVYYNER
mgnify:CR=1 FL=1